MLCINADFGNIAKNTGKTIKRVRADSRIVPMGFWWPLAMSVAGSHYLTVCGPRLAHCCSAWTQHELLLIKAKAKERKEIKIQIRSWCYLIEMWECAFPAPTWNPMSMLTTTTIPIIIIIIVIVIVISSSCESHSLLLWPVQSDEERKHANSNYATVRQKHAWANVPLGHNQTHLTPFLLPFQLSSSWTLHLPALRLFHSYSSI